MIASASLRFGMVGAGGIAQAYAQAFRDTNIAALVAVADVRTESAEAIAQSISAKPYASHEEMADAENLDAVVVCTPPVTHRNICAELANRRLHVLCEKPLAIDSKSAREMFDAAVQNNVKLTMATKFRYAADVIRAKSIVSSGILGDVILFENCFTGHVDMSQRWNSNPEISGGGVLIDNGTHSVDIIRYFLGPVAEVQVFEGRRGHRDSLRLTSPQCLATRQTHRMAAENRQRRNTPCRNRAGVVVPEELVGIIIEGTAEVTAEAVTKNSEQKESLKFRVKLLVGIGIFAVIIGCVAIFNH